MKYAPIAFLAAAALLGGCSHDATAQNKQAVETPAPQLVAAQNGPANRPWYAERFEALGFHVFEEPTSIPDFKVQPRSGGESAGPADFKGKIILLNFWATWCPPCRQEMPSIEALHKALSGEAFTVFAVSVKESSNTVAAFLKQNPYTYPIYLDTSGEVSSNFASRGIPTTFVLDKDGKAIAAIIGSRSYSDPEVIRLFKELARR